MVLASPAGEVIRGVTDLLDADMAGFVPFSACISLFNPWFFKLASQGQEFGAGGTESCLALPWGLLKEIIWDRNSWEGGGRSLRLRWSGKAERPGGGATRRAGDSQRAGERLDGKPVENPPELIGIKGENGGSLREQEMLDWDGLTWGKVQRTGEQERSQMEGNRNFLL